MRKTSLKQYLIQERKAKDVGSEDYADGSVGHAVFALVLHNLVQEAANVVQ